ncbi:DNA/RNA non-specific endonuclease [Hymenobacter elongatus]|uniref:DNA/RNA non-specific endonuclease n=1 Tax=Hymenobacter elongatus TaxID=877208 RepID=A0A4Z0PPS4_9BACT|nr:DNA/RNA non-specific endonuclease [Hymenobacter elongatus]TGE18900.1 DNA/RNA non-specific endonuclease [Hymenobacter elongatus]
MATTNGKSQDNKATQEEAFMEELKTFVRNRGADFLTNPNITSVGIGYKEKDGQTTGAVSIQFTVAQKASPESVREDLHNELIPEFFVIDGKQVPTDVIERSYQTAYRRVPVAVANARKQRVNPIVPGVSVSNYHGSAGTIGCIVYDQHSGAPYILSNWHVLHGPKGQIGDDVVQPGPYDDNRVEQNRVGKLVRSHLGAAGDCAVASIEGRDFQADILDLNVGIDEIGEPELGDKVIKSGRTTGVTHGMVTRVHTIARIDYGGRIGDQAIGCFEIGPDANHLPADGEVSKGGDSGSVWMFKADNGRTTRIMAGLHFAGESAGDPNERALSCYARSVFEKMEVVLSAPVVQPQTIEETLARGYETTFLSVAVPEPTLTVAGRKNAVGAATTTEVVRHTHFSVVMHAERRFAMWVAWNIDGGQMRKINRKGIPFVLDPAVDPKYQVTDKLYAGNRLDRGHLARRADLCWGSAAEAQQANHESFYFTNITPQIENFNQSSQGGIWGKLEDAIFEQVDVQNLRVSVFGGPIFHAEDRAYRGVQIPREFYKVLVYVEGTKLRARAFMLTQNLDGLEALDLEQFRVYQVTLSEVEARCEFRFPEVLKAGDGFAKHLARTPEAATLRPYLVTLDDVVW